MILDSYYLTYYKKLFEQSHVGEIGCNLDWIDELIAAPSGIETKVNLCCINMAPISKLRQSLLNCITISAEMLLCSH